MSAVSTALPMSTPLEPYIRMRAVRARWTASSSHGWRWGGRGLSLSTMALSVDDDLLHVPHGQTRDGLALPGGQLGLELDLLLLEDAGGHRHQGLARLVALAILHLQLHPVLPVGELRDGRVEADGLAVLRREPRERE